MRNKTPPASRHTSLIVVGLVLLLARGVVAQEAETTPPVEPVPDEAISPEPTAPDSSEALEASAEEPADEEPVEESTPAEEPVAEESAPEAAPGEEPAAEEPAAEEPAQDAQPVVEPAIQPSPAEVPRGGESQVEAEVEEIQVDAIIPTAARREREFWQVLGLYELHFNLISDDYSANDWYSWYMLRGNLDITDVDQISLRMDLTQRYIADPDESGLWFGDMRLYYSRRFTIPIPDFPIAAKGSVYLTAPTSRGSQERGYITRPTGILTLVPSWGPLTLIVNGYFRWSFARWAESSHGEDPNEMMMTGFDLQLFYQVFDWFSPSVAWQSAWTEDYPTREGDRQPWQEAYYFEIAANFSIPMPEVAPSLDISLAYAQGADVLEDGVYRLYFAKRDQSEIYLGLNLTY